MTADEAEARFADLEHIAERRQGLAAELLRFPAVDGYVDDPAAYPVRAQIHSLDRRANIVAAELEAWRVS